MLSTLWQHAFEIAQNKHTPEPWLRKDHSKGTLTMKEDLSKQNRCLFLDSWHAKLKKLQTFSSYFVAGLWCPRFQPQNTHSCVLKVLPNVLFVFVSLLVFELWNFVLQVNDGTLNLIVLTDQRYPAVDGKNNSQDCISRRGQCYKHKLHSHNLLGLQLSEFATSCKLIILSLPIYVLNLLSAKHTVIKE